MTRPDPLAVACPKCGRIAGVPCFAWYRDMPMIGHETKPHAARVRAAEKEKEKEESR